MQKTLSDLNRIAQSVCIALCFLLLLLIPHQGLAHKKEPSNKKETANKKEAIKEEGIPAAAPIAMEELAKDELAVYLEVKGIGNLDMIAIYRNKNIYLPVSAVFDLLHIKNMTTPNMDSVTGFYINEGDVFVIDQVNSRILFKDTITNLQHDDLLRYETGLYLNLKYFKTVFGLEGIFNFRTMTVTMSSGLEMPVVREARLDFMRRNMGTLKGEMKADTTIKRVYRAFHFGTADWAIMSTQQSAGHDETRLNLGLGAAVAGGEFNASLNWYARAPNDEKQQFYQWRHVNNDNPLLRQVTAGKIFTQSISTLYAPLLGVQLTNASTTYRRAYGSYTLSNTTEPGWIVELYVNGVLVDYKKTDVSGFYSFEVPLVYGYSVVKLRFYGPYGEERTSQQFINIPFNFIPVHEFEYTASAGMVEDGLNSVFSRISGSYGLSNKITLGGGVEYLSSIKTGATIPFLTTSIKLASRLFLSGDYTYGVRKKGMLSYHHPSSIQVDLAYTKYDPGQKAIYYNYLEERKAIVSIPIRAGAMALYTRLIVGQITVPGTQYTNAEWSFLGTVKKLSISISNYASFMRSTNPYFYGLYSASFTLPGKIVFTSQLQYDYKSSAVQFLKFSAEKRLFGNGYLSASYQEFYNNNLVEHVNGNYQNFMVGMRYDFAFAKVACFALRDNNHGYTNVEYASGSFMYDRQTNYAHATSRANVGKGGIVVEPYLDMNCNNRRDPGEPKVPGLKLKVNGGRIFYDKSDTTIRISDIEPYVNYYVDLNNNMFDNIAWQIRNRIICIAISPSSFTRVEVPISVVGEVSGMVLLKDKNGKKPKGESRISIHIYDSFGSRVATTLSESDGFFSYLGLAPGDYTVQPDSVQLQKLSLRPIPGSLPIHISQKSEGDVGDGLEFVLQSVTKDAAGKEGNYVPNMRVEIVPVVEQRGYSILVDVFDNAISAGILKSRLIRLFKLPVTINQLDDDFKVLITGFKDRKGAEALLPGLEKAGYGESWIIRPSGKNKHSS